MYPVRFRGSASAEMTFPRAKSDLLMCPVSLTCSPSDLDSERRSDPARSTRTSLPPLAPAPAATWPRCMCSVMMQCERDESLFSWCEETCGTTWTCLDKQCRERRGQAIQSAINSAPGPSGCASLRGRRASRPRRSRTPPEADSQRTRRRASAGAAGGGSAMSGARERARAARAI